MQSGFSNINNFIHIKLKVCGNELILRFVFAIHKAILLREKGLFFYHEVSEKRNK